MRFGNWMVAVLSASLLVACPKRDSSAADAMATALEAIDVAWNARGRRGLPPVGLAVQAAVALDSANPGLLWRRARYELAMGVADADARERERWFGQARAHGWKCLRGDLQFTSNLRESDLNVALAELGTEHVPCVSWTALAGARWYREFGTQAAAIDEPAIDALIASAAAREGSGNRQRSAWARALRSDSPDAPWGAVEDDDGGVVSLDRFRYAPQNYPAETLRRVQSPSPEAKAYREWLVGG